MYCQSCRATTDAVLSGRRADGRVYRASQPVIYIRDFGILGSIPIPMTPGGREMDKNRVKGTIDDAAGRAKRQVGEWTGNTKTQVEGAAQQIKGKTEKVVGNVKDAFRDAHDDAAKEHKKDTVEHSTARR